MATTTKKEKLGNHSNSKITKSKKEKSLMIPSLTQCNSYIIVYWFQLSKFKKGEIFMIPSLTQ